ncbi:hypothetical protein [Lichenicoccus sp.]|uniref:hypothetical protein n=1 Tax=Lichenicoccus sp. TaxID=2781899 RepID=UPI003D0B0FF6
MSATMPTNISIIESGVLTSLPGLIGIAFAGKLAPVSVTIQKEIGSVDVSVVAELVKLQVALDTIETGSPLVVSSIVAFHQIATVLGLALPTEDAIFQGVKAAAHDVLESLLATS